MRKVIQKSILAIFIPIFLLVSGQNSHAAKSEEYIVVGALLGIPFWQDPIAGMNAASKELDVKVTFIGPPDWNAADQVTQLQQALLRKPAGVVILPVDPNSVNAIIKKALADKIPVVTADSDAPESGRLCFLGTERYGAGVQAADYLVSKMGTTGKVGVVTLGGSLALETSLSGFREQLAKIAPAIEIVSEIDSKGNPVVITNGLNAMLQGHPDLNAVFANGTQEISSVATAVKQSGKADQLVIVGQGATLNSRDIMHAVKEGIVDASITQRSFQQFYYAIKMLYDLNHQKNSAFGLSWAKTGINPLPKFVDSGTMVITADNVNTFYNSLPK